MASLRELRSRIRSIQSTKKITKAQEMIATSRITKAQERVTASKPFASEISRVVSELATASSSLDHRMLSEPVNPQRVAVLVVTSDKGKCGGYNNNVLKETEELLSLLRSEGKDPVVYVLGAKGLEYYTFRQRPVRGAWTGFSQTPKYTDVRTATDHLAQAFLASSQGQVAAVAGLIGEDTEIAGYDEVHLVYTRFVSMLTQTPEVRRVLPIEKVEETEVIQQGEDALAKPLVPVTAEFDFEPDADTLLDALLPKYVSTRIFSALLEAAASESAARRAAMKAATDNATELEKNLSRIANQARQAQITQEISEIVGGAGALAASAGRD